MQIAPKQVILKRIKKLLRQQKISLLKFGEILTNNVDISPQAKHQKARRFLDGGQKNIGIAELERIAELFEKPILYFLDQKIGLESPEQGTSPELPFEKIAYALQELGYDQGFIDTHIAHLRATKIQKKEK